MPFPHLPKPIYEVLPQVYAVAGLGAALWSENALGVLSGLALVGVSAYIRVVRNRYRLADAQRLARIDARLRRARAPKDCESLP